MSLPSMRYLLPGSNSAGQALLSLRLSTFARQTHAYRFAGARKGLYEKPTCLSQTLSSLFAVRGKSSWRPRINVGRRNASTGQPELPQRENPARIRAREYAYIRSRHRSNTFFLYVGSVAVGFVGLTYMAVPLYRLFCQTTGLGGTVQTDVSRFTEKDFMPVRMSERIKITFNADRSRALPWSFAPQQREVRVLPGETALAFFTASNLSDRDIIGVSTYNITPAKAGIYFNKIQCFCFEEQMLRAGEVVDMPVFFFIDPEFASDPNMDDVKSITLSYTFFESRHNKLI